MNLFVMDFSFTVTPWNNQSLYILPFIYLFFKFVPIKIPIKILKSVFLSISIYRKHLCNNTTSKSQGLEIYFKMIRSK